MKYFPYENLIFTTKLSKEEVSNRIKDQLETKKSIRFSFMGFGSKTKPYEGKIWEDNFTISRIIHYRNSFLPIIDGTIKNDLNGSTITVKMHLPFSVLIFVLLFSSCCLILFMTIVLKSISINEFTRELVYPLCMFAFAYGLSLGGFKYESNKSIKFLKALFEGEITQS